VTNQINMMDRDDYLALQRAETEDVETEDEIARLQREINAARESLRISEKNLAAIEAALSGKNQSDS
jgi:hypothetical protein